MAKYFNRGRGNLPLALPGGKSITVPGNSWIELTGSDETCRSVIRALAKGQLYRRALRAVPEAKTVEVKTEAPSAAAPKLVAEEETPQTAAVGESKPQTAEDPEEGANKASSYRRRSR